MVVARVPPRRLDTTVNAGVAIGMSTAIGGVISGMSDSEHIRQNKMGSATPPPSLVVVVDGFS